MRLSKSPLVSVWLLALALASSVGTPAAAADVVVTDAGGRVVRIADASRILAIGGDVTEIVYALGAGARVVGVDTTSQFPPEALKEKKSVGYMRALSSEGVISVDATLILASERSGPPEVVKTLKATSVPYVEIPDQHSAAGHRRQGAADRARGRRRGRGREAWWRRSRPTSRRWPSAPPRSSGRCAPCSCLACRTAASWSAARAPAPMRSCELAGRRERGDGGQRLPSAARRGDRRAGAGGDRRHAPQLRQRRPRPRRSCSRSRASHRRRPAPTSASSSWTACISWASARALPPPRASSWASSIPILPAATRAQRDDGGRDDGRSGTPRGATWVAPAS